MASGEEDWTSSVSANITNAEITVGGDLTATIDGAVSIVGVPDVIITNPGDINVSVTNASIPITHTGDLDVNITNADLTISGEVTFPSTQNVNISSTTGDLNCAITNASIPITHVGDLDVNITNADMAITAGTLDVDIQNASINAVILQPSTFEHFSGVVDDTADTINFAATSSSIFIDNQSWINLKVSFDTGTSWFNIAPHTSLNAELRVDSIQIKAGTEIAGVSASYQMLIAEG